MDRKNLNNDELNEVSGGGKTLDAWNKLKENYLNDINQILSEISIGMGKNSDWLKGRVNNEIANAIVNPTEFINKVRSALYEATGSSNVPEAFNKLKDIVNKFNK